MAVLSSISKATGVWTCSDQPDNGETCTIGDKVYTFEDTLTNVNGNVKIGATLTVTLQNFLNAINLGPGAGTAYAALMTINPYVRATASDATTLTVEAKIAGASLVATSDTHGEGAWGDTELEGGTGNPATALQEIVDQCQLNSEVITLLGKIISL